MDDGPAPRLQGSAQLGLLGYLTESALDEDYQLVARRRPSGQVRRRRSLVAGVAMVFGFLCIVAAVQTSQGQSEAESGRGDLIAALRSGRADLATKLDRASALRSEVAVLRAKVLTSTTLSQRTRRELTRLGLATGTIEARGPGVVVTVDDAEGATQDRDRVLDIDLQRLVNGLWAAGAEAISINGHRLGPLSAIRQAGVAITVNYQSLSRPYVVRALGNRDRLPARFAETASGRAWLDLQRRVGLRFEMRGVEDQTLPALPTPTLRHVRPAKERSS